MSLKLVPKAAYMYDAKMTSLEQFSSGSYPVFVHPSLYRALKLTFRGDIGNLSLDSIKSKMGTGTIGQAVGVLTSAMFNVEERP